MPPLRLSPRVCNSRIRTPKISTRAFCSGSRKVMGVTACRYRFASAFAPRLGAKGAIDVIPARSIRLRVGRRAYATATSADDIIEELTEQYGVARDEFEIASEETDKQSIYASDDRAAAAEELQKLQEMYSQALKGEHGEEIKRRVGQRLRELEQGVRAMEERAIEDH